MKRVISHREIIWINELPTWQYPVHSVRKATLSVLRSSRQRGRAAAIEMMQPVGGMCYYGGLGVLVTPEAGATIQVEVVVSAGEGREHQSALFPPSLTFEKCHIGLPEEFAEPLFQELMQFPPLRYLPAGKISFCRAVYGEVGSSPSFFQRLGRMTVLLLLLGESQLAQLSERILVSEQQLVNVIQQLENGSSD
jgi:hypothetical protein